MTLSLKTEAYPGRVFEGRVSAVSPAADSQSRVFQVEVTLPNPEQALKIGMIGSLVLPEASMNAMLVPLGAVVRAPGSSTDYAVYVTMKSGEKTIASARRVELGQVLGDEISVSEGLRPGEQIIVNGATRVVDGEPVRVIP